MKVAWVEPWRDAFWLGLVWVPTGCEGSLEGPAVRALVRAEIPEIAYVLDQYGPALRGQLQAERGRTAGLSAFAWAFRARARFRAALGEGARALTAASFDDPRWGALALRAPESLEGLMLAALETEPRFTAWVAQRPEVATREACAAAIEALGRAVGLDDTVWLSRVMGARGRAFGRDIVVGAVAPEGAAMQWLHERAVGAAQGLGHRDWAACEGVAEAALTRLVAGTEWAAAHRRWHDGFDWGRVMAARGSDVEAVVSALRSGVPSPDGC